MLEIGLLKPQVNTIMKLISFSKSVQIAHAYVSASDSLAVFITLDVLISQVEESNLSTELNSINSQLTEIQKRFHSLHHTLHKYVPVYEKWKAKAPYSLP